MLFQLKDVSFSYPDKKVLEGICLELCPGKFYGILGPNGSGKTTLLDLLFGYKRPSSGRLLYKGQVVASYGQKELAREMALVPQDFQVNFPFQVQDIVLMGRYPHISRFQAPGSKDWAILKEVLTQTGIYSFKNSYVTELSGGEKQRVIFARALAQRTPVLMLDEATSNLDVKYGFQLLDLARDRNQKEGVTVIAVFHDINQAASYCDQLIFLKQGRLVTWDQTSRVLDPDLLYEVFKVRAKVYYEPFLDCQQVVFKSNGLNNVA